MKYTLVSCHPYDRSFNAAMVQEIRDLITQNGSSLDEMDLTQMSFNPVLSPADLYEFSQTRTTRGVRVENLDPVAVDLAQRVNGSDHLLLVFPPLVGTDARPDERVYRQGGLPPDFLHLSQ